MNVTQPTLSRQLMQLEEELEVKLFRRGNHNIELTEEGYLFRRRAQEIVNLICTHLFGWDIIGSKNKRVNLWYR